MRTGSEGIPRSIAGDGRGDGGFIKASVVQHVSPCVGYVRVLETINCDRALSFGGRPVHGHRVPRALNRNRIAEIRVRPQRSDERNSRVLFVSRAAVSGARVAVTRAAPVSRRDANHNGNSSFQRYDRGKIDNVIVVTMRCTDALCARSYGIVIRLTGQRRYR